MFIEKSRIYKCRPVQIQIIYLYYVCIIMCVIIQIHTTSVGLAMFIGLKMNGKILLALAFYDALTHNNSDS